MKIKTVALLLVMFTFCLCSPSDKEKSLPSEAAVQKTTDTVNKTKAAALANGCEANDRVAYTFLKETRVFENSDSTSNILFTLPFNTPFRILHFIDKDEMEGSDYVEIKDSIGRRGFILSQELPQNMEVAYLTEELFLINRHPTLSNTALIRKAALKGHDIKEEYTVPCSATYTFYTTYNIPLSGFESTDTPHPFQLFKYETEMNACPGLILTEFIYYDGKRLHPLVHGESEGEFSYSHAITPYLPYRCGNGKIMHLPDGNPDAAFDTYEGVLRVMQVPKQYPARNTIVLLRQDIEYLIGADGDLVLNEKGQTKKSKDSTSVVYYVWNGSKLVKQ
jgi:hypothetical protein